MQIYWNKRKCLHRKIVQLPGDWFGTPTWPPFHCFGTPIWLPWRHVKTLHREARWPHVLCSWATHVLSQCLSLARCKWPPANLFGRYLCDGLASHPEEGKGRGGGGGGGGGGGVGIRINLKNVGPPFQLTSKSHLHSCMENHYRLLWPWFYKWRLLLSQFDL